MRKTHLTVLAIVLAALVLAIGAVSALADLASDATPPTTTTDAVPSYRGAATITATATDDQGIAYIYHELDEGVVRLHIVAGSPLTASLVIPTDKDTPLAAGTHELKYWAQDTNGNVEAQTTVPFEIFDTIRPTTRAYAATVVRGRTATLEYKVNDASPTKGTATVTIKVKNRAGAVVKTIRPGVVSVNVKNAAKYVRCRLAKGTYKFYVYATDASGNVQSRIGYNKLVVR